MSKRIGLWLAGCLLAIQVWADDLPPLYLAQATIDPTDSICLGLMPAPQAETFTVFSPTDDSHHFCNGAVAVTFKGVLYCMWQCSERDEDAPETWVAYSQSRDNGATWSKPRVLAAATDTEFYTSGGWWATADTLVALINTWRKDEKPKGGSCRYMVSTDGEHWTEPQAVTMADGTALNGLMEQDIHQLPNGRLITAAHFMPGMQVCPIYSDHPLGIGGWQRGNFAATPRGDQSREMEPSTYVRHDGKLVMVFRDQSSTFLKMAATSDDNGATWSRAALTNVPDARTKQCAGNLPDGTAYMVGCPVRSKKRLPLVLMTSRDGCRFDHAWLLRNGGSDLPPRRYEGKAKTLGYNYPKATVSNGFLFIAYSVNKEDILLTRIPITYLESASSD